MNEGWNIDISIVKLIFLQAQYSMTWESFGERLGVTNTSFNPAIQLFEPYRRRHFLHFQFHLLGVLLCFFRHFLRQFSQDYPIFS